MSGVDGYVQGPPDSTGKKIDNDVLTIGADQVYRQRIRISGFVATDLADVQATTPAGTETGLVTRNIPSGTQTVTVNNAAGASAINIQDGGNSITVDGSVGVTATVATDDPTLTAGATSGMSLTTAGRLRIDTEAGTRDFDGVMALYVGDRVLRRQAEQAQLDAYLARMQSIISSEWESSQRMGFEVR